MLQRLAFVFVLPAALSLSLTGCGEPYRVVPVSGKVTLDGKPVANVRVVFQPSGGKNGMEPGPGSSGVTDAQGQYTLTTTSAKPKPGAVIGTHTVQFGAVMMPKPGQEAAIPDPKAPKIPSTSQVFEVPTAGTDQANFDLKPQALQRSPAFLVRLGQRARIGPWHAPAWWQSWPESRLAPLTGPAQAAFSDDPLTPGPDLPLVCRRVGR